RSPTGARPVDRPGPARGRNPFSRRSGLPGGPAGPLPRCPSGEPPMSMPQNGAPGTPAVGVIPPQAPRRPPAPGPPARRVRAILALMVVGLVCLMVLLPGRADAPRHIPAYLVYLLFMVLGHFFAAHGHSIGRAAGEQASPLNLPRGFVRLVILVALIA